MDHLICALFLLLTLLNTHWRSFPIRCKIYGSTVFKEKNVLLTFALVKLLTLASLFNIQKKHVLNYFALEMAAIIVARGGTAENRERVEGEDFSTCTNLLESQKNTLSEHMVFNKSPAEIPTPIGDVLELRSRICMHNSIPDYEFKTFSSLI